MPAQVSRHLPLCATKVLGIVEEFAEHQSPLQRRDHHGGRLPRVRVRLQLPARHAFLYETPHEPLPVGGHPGRSLLERRVGVVGLHGGVEHRASTRHRRVLDQPPELVDDRQQTNQHPFLALEGLLEAPPHDPGREIERGERQILLASEVVVDSRLLQLRLARHFAHGGTRIPPGVEYGRGALHDTPPRPFALAHRLTHPLLLVAAPIDDSLRLHRYQVY